MIDQILERLRLVPGVEVREGFYASILAKEERFIFLQPFTSEATMKGGANCRETLTLQVVMGVNVSRDATPTQSLLALTRAVRSALFKGESDPSHPKWLKPAAGNSFGVNESEPCKYIMPEAQERHALGVITLSLSTAQPL